MKDLESSEQALESKKARVREIRVADAKIERSIC